MNELQFFQNITHLNKRFWFSLNPEQLSEEDLHWVRSQLSQNEFAHWVNTPAPPGVSAVPEHPQLCTPSKPPNFPKPTGF